MRSAGSFALQMAGCRFHPRPRPLRRIGSVSRCWGKRWGETPTTSIAVCILRLTSTPISSRRNASCARSLKATTEFPMRSKRVGTVFVRARRNIASHGSRRLVLLGHRLSWSASGVPISPDNWCGLPETFCHMCAKGNLPWGRRISMLEIRQPSPDLTAEIKNRRRHESEWTADGVLYQPIECICRYDSDVEWACVVKPNWN